MFSFFLPEKWRYLGATVMLVVVLLANVAQAAHAASDPCLNDQTSSNFETCVQTESKKENSDKYIPASNGVFAQDTDVGSNCHTCCHFVNATIEKISHLTSLSIYKPNSIVLATVIEDLLPKGLFRPPRTV